MNSVHFLSFILTAILFHSVQSDVCDFDDEECLLKGANNFYNRIVRGVDGIAKPSDPLYYDKIIGQIQNLNYRLTNIKMTGLKNCEGIKSVIQNTSQAGVLLYRYDLHCPKLVLEYNYEGKGKLGPIDIDGKGLATITAVNYVIIFTGQYEEFISDKDCEPHLVMKNNKIDTDPRGELTLEAESFSKNKTIAEEALKYINSHSKELEKYLRCPIMTKLMEKLNVRQNRLLKSLPVDEIFSA